MGGTKIHVLALANGQLQLLPGEGYLVSRASYLAAIEALYVVMSVCPSAG